jgi:F0F1-type ATP synthase assembly protein I
MVGIGMELAGSVLVLAAIGYGVDRYVGNQRPWGVVVGALIGFAFGMFNLFRLVAKINK